MPTDILFLTITHDLPGISDGYSIEYYQPASYQRLRGDVSLAAKHYLSLFSESFDYQDCFSSADYGISEDSFDDGEIDIFRSALRAGERRDPFDDLHPRDIFRGCCAVIRARLQNGALALTRSGIELFNLVMECALLTDDNRNPNCSIQLQTAKEFAPAFIDGLFDLFETLGYNRRIDSRLQHIGKAFRPLQPLAEVLRRSVHLESWPRSDLDLGRFLLVLDFHQQVIRTFDGTDEP